MRRFRMPIVLLGLIVLLAAAAPASQEEKPRLERPRDYKAHLVGHAHIDLAWLWRWEESVHDIGVQTFGGTLAQMARTPGLTFAQSQPAIYEAIEKAYPDLFAEIRRRVREGTWLPVGGMWAEPDLNMPDGEALARQLLYGKRYFLDKFGVDVKVGWNPDAFGHNAQLPQILSRAGLTSYVFERCAPPKAPAFRWEAKDGSSLLAFVPPGWYSLSLKDGLNEVLAGVAGQTPLKDFLILYGEGDHGGGPRDTDLAAIRKYEKDKDQPRLAFSTPEAFFAEVEKTKAALPVVRGELNFTFPACYTTQAETKKNNRRSEALLVTAEKFSALAVSAGFRDYYPERDIDEAWKIVLRNQFHDIFDGSAIGPVYEEAGKAYRQAFERGQRALDFSLETLISALDTRGEGTPVVVFNPLCWTRTDPVTAETSVLGSPPGLKLTDPRGGDVPVQVLERRERGSSTRFRYVFLAREVPSFGYRIYRATGTEAAPAPAAVTADTAGLENEFFRIAIDPKAGDLSSVFDKKLGREILAGPANVLQAIADEPEVMSAWELGLKDRLGTVGGSGAKIEIAERGPVRAVVRITAPFRRSLFVRDVILYAGVPRVDFDLRLDWRERNVMIKAAFPLAVKEAQAEFEIPYGSVVRPADGAEVPALRWVDLSETADGGWGATLVNDCKYGFDVKEATIRMSVVHGATYPDPEADRGVQSLSYALMAHAGGSRDGEAIRRGLEFNNPLLAREAMGHPASSHWSAAASSLPAEASFMAVEPGNVVLSAFKKEYGYYNRDYIIRLYETAGQKTEAAVTLPWAADAWDADLIERPLEGPAMGTEGRELKVSLAPFEIRTLRIVKRLEK